MTSSESVSTNPSITFNPLLHSGNYPTPGKTKKSPFLIDCKSFVTSIFILKLLSIMDFLNAFSTDLKFPEP